MADQKPSDHENNSEEFLVRYPHHMRQELEKKFQKNERSRAFREGLRWVLDGKPQPSGHRDANGQPLPNLVGFVPDLFAFDGGKFLMAPQTLRITVRDFSRWIHMYFNASHLAARARLKRPTTFLALVSDVDELRGVFKAIAFMFQGFDLEELRHFSDSELFRVYCIADADNRLISRNALNILSDDRVTFNDFSPFQAPWGLTFAKSVDGPCLYTYFSSFFDANLRQAMQSEMAEAISQFYEANAVQASRPSGGAEDPGS
ncbi:hypothetical protein EN866_19615 [Mesorhizobium sp. M2D.F.Ca.ET.223.01.1.1]|uniref:hypothetical protein n=1 Tax=unclassified Mesorhizobium TaxID=325217 RepID=UPI000FCA6CEF|nr:MULTISPECIES: hypothetical protein [unclassified Mesorhizobium]TGP89370.1 hypothetical protein EN864_19625 [bacterium M00.F.Ca.ET.221.01.1.1]TGP94743.1 hypothetical protein EN865_15495 [bacterium M00.F.Ca.ET.222.01.1.1]RVD58843.1 hypothetical protein EN783_14500 [Mesorhizobium sp. M2D.F.Ca.ET.140.01.1.1]TGP27871.1 hypothetical protein EN875_032980 [Mesorhizobium sp. M2D.F.Ca.ET.232.01.1.1]TGP75911.1 hypothetical protein EN867_15495 [Mesorhizobium sp. M2D.F.Ca.ET.224.01.1.1]